MHGKTKHNNANKEKNPSQNMVAADGKIGGLGSQKDALTALFLKENRNFAEVFNHTILKNAPVSPEKLSTDDIRETATIRLTENGILTLTQYRDVVKSVKDGTNCLILGIENQTLDNFQMSFRVMARDFINYARQVRIVSDQHKNEFKEKKNIRENVQTEEYKTRGLVLEPEIEWKSEEEQGEKISGTPKISDAEYISRFYQSDQLFPCITLVIYWGEGSWNGPQSLSDMFGNNKWAAYAPDYSIYVLEVQKMTEEEILSYSDDLKMVFGCVRFSRQKKELKRFLAENKEALKLVSWTARNVIVEMMGSVKLKEIFFKNTAEEEDYTMVQALEEMLADAKEEGMIIGAAKGRAEGREEGRAEGREEGRAEGREEGREEGRREEQKNTERETLRANKAERELAILRARMARQGHV